MRQRDLLGSALFRRFVRSRLYPSALQYPLLLVFLFIVLSAFTGTVQASKNSAILVTWSLWWPLLPFSFLLFGRLWCGVCPLAKVGDLVQRSSGRKRRPPGPFLKRYGIWIMVVLFILLTWFDRVSSFASSPHSTGVLLLLLLLGAITTMLFFQRRAWCRYLCPLGGLSGIYSTVSFLELRPRTETCRSTCRQSACLTGSTAAERCPLFERPLRLESNRNCNLCGNCVKLCEHQALALRLRSPVKELSELRERIPAESFLALVMVVLVYIQTVSMAKIFPRYMKWFIEGSFIKNYDLAFTVNFVGMLLLGVALYVLTAYLASLSSGEPFLHLFTSFGYGLIPLGLGGYVAHDLFHLVKEGRAAAEMVLVQTGIILGSGGPSHGAHALGAQDLSLKTAQIAVVSLGALASFLATFRSNRKMGGNPSFNWRRVTPFLFFLVLLSAAYLELFFFPMNPRHFH